MANKKILMVATFSVNIPHFETELEIIENHLNDGDDVHVTKCNQHLLACDVNPWHNYGKCSKCVGRANTGFGLFKGQITEHFHNDFWTDEDKKFLEKLRLDFEDLNDLKTYKITEGGVEFDIGEAVLSTLVSTYRDPSNKIFRDKELVKKFMWSTYYQFKTSLELLAKENFDIVYTFNGRFSINRGIMRICQQKGIKVYLHERGCNEQRYTLFEDDLAQSIYLRKKMIADLWEETDNVERERIGAEFYENRVAGLQQAWLSYTDQQSKDLLPENYDPKKKNIVIYSSSEDEFVAVGEEYVNPLYDDQISAVKSILADLEKDTSFKEKYHIYLRMHPNLSNLNIASVKGMEELSADFFTYIAPESKVSSYTLLKNADKVLSFGSTIGIEATFWDIPSITAGRSFYEDLGGTYNPQSHDELVEFLRTDLVPKPKLGALQYGLYEMRYGTVFKHFNPNGLFDGRYKGKKIRPAFWVKVYQNYLEKIDSVSTFADERYMAKTYETYYTQQSTNGAKNRIL